MTTRPEECQPNLRNTCPLFPFCSVPVHTSWVFVTCYHADVRVGFAVFFASPSLGLAPEIPGTLAADLLDRQIWWIGAALSAAIGLGAVILAPQPSYKVLGAVLVFVPHIIGAPHPDVIGGNAPQALANQFVVASAITNAVFWAVLGVSSAYAYIWLNRRRN